MQAVLSKVAQPLIQNRPFTQYKLLTQPDETRLVILHSGTLWSTINCTLKHFRLGDNVQYDALSYVWGTPKKWRNITLDGHVCSVGWNLFEALQYLRHPTHDRYLWVDALCINQRSDEERGHQVAQMSVIYARARCVRLYLGHSTSMAARAFQALQQVQGDEYVADFGQELVHICSRAYWSRLWVIQEVVLARTILIHCSDMELPWEAFATTVLQNPQAMDELRNCSAARLCLRRRNYVNQARSSIDRGASLLTLFSMHHDAECADVRDKLYGLHGFAYRCCQEEVPVDYSCTAYELCTRVIAHETKMHHSSDRDILLISIRLHRIMVFGAINQKSLLQSRFEIGAWDTHITSFPPRSQITTYHFASMYGEVIWTSPPLNQDWRWQITRNWNLDDLCKALTKGFLSTNRARNFYHYSEMISPLITAESTPHILEGEHIPENLYDYRDAILASSCAVRGTKDVIAVVRARISHAAGYRYFLFLVDNQSAAVGCGICLVGGDMHIVLSPQSQESGLPPIIRGRALPIRKQDKLRAPAEQHTPFHADILTILQLSEVLPGWDTVK